VEAEGDNVVQQDPDDAVAIDERWELVFVGQVVGGFSGLQVVVCLIVGEPTFGIWLPSKLMVNGSAMPRGTTIECGILLIVSTGRIKANP
jgi:hypothetical protein